MKKLSLNQTINVALPEVIKLIQEMPIVPNTCVDLQELFVIVLGIVGNFRPFVEYLMLIIDEGGKLTDTAYDKC